MADELHWELAEYQGRVPVTVFRIAGEINTNTNQQLQAKAERST